MKEILSKVQKIKMEIDPISKDIANDFFKSKYFDINKLLNEVECKLIEYDLVLLQPIINGCVVTQIIDIETGQKIESSIELPKSDNPQKTGSAITYFRRYSLQSLLGLIAQDDDGNKSAQSDQSQDDKAWLNIGDPAWTKGLSIKKPIKELREFYKISKANAAEYENQLKLK